MRVTTLMLDKNAQKTGLPYTRGNSLLNYVNNTSSGTGNPLLDALGKNSGTTATNQKSSEIAALLASKNKSNYEKLGKGADQLSQAVASLTAEGEDSAFARAEKTGDTSAVQKQVQTLATSYNEVLKNLQTQTDPLNQYYGEMLREAAAENCEALKSLGITIGKDGVLSVDQSKLKEADVQSLKDVFGASKGFMSKLSFLASRISGNAQANAQSTASWYNAAGSRYAASGNKYDFLG